MGVRYGIEAIKTLIVKENLKFDSILKETHNSSHESV
jgi:hypothetical protein